jgi:UDP:flavonoid glycosyltransferase YjiC (YdhE family)
MDVLTVTWDAGGNLPPMFGLGRELTRRGHRVRCLGPEAIRAAVEQAGMELRPLVSAAAYDPRVPMSLEASQEAQGAVFFGGGYAADVIAEFGQAMPDVVVIDCFLIAAQAAAEARRAQTVLLAHTPPGWFVPFWNQVLLPPTNVARTAAGVSPVGSTTELWSRAAIVLAATSRELDGSGEIAARVKGLRYTGPIFEAAGDGAIDIETVAPPGKEPLVVVGFSTTFMRQEGLIGRVIEALAQLKVRGIVTAGPAVDIDQLPTAPNVRVHRWLPHASLLPAASLVITHAGHTTVAKALSWGVPLLCIPLGRDQGYIARRVEEIGAGMAVDPAASADALAVAAATVLATGAFRRKAIQMADAMAADEDPAVVAANEVEAAATAPPAFR